MEGIAAATRWRTACATSALSAPSVRSTTEAEGGCLGAAERAFVRHHQMDARRLDAAHGLDGARQLAFQRAHAGDFLHEGGEAERAELVEQFVAGAAGARQALFRQQHARMGGVAVGDIDRGAVGGDVERHACILERGADARDVLLVEAGIENFIGRAAEIIAGDADKAEHDQANRRRAARSGAARARAGLKTGVRFVRGSSFRNPARFCDSGSHIRPANLRGGFRGNALERISCFRDVPWLVSRARSFRQPSCGRFHRRSSRTAPSSRRPRGSGTAAWTDTTANPPVRSSSAIRKCGARRARRGGRARPRDGRWRCRR